MTRDDNVINLNFSNDRHQFLKAPSRQGESNVYVRMLPLQCR